MTVLLCFTVYGVSRFMGESADNETETLTIWPPTSRVVE